MGATSVELERLTPSTKLKPSDYKLQRLRLKFLGIALSLEDLNPLQQNILAMLLFTKGITRFCGVYIYRSMQACHFNSHMNVNGA